MKSFGPPQKLLIFIYTVALLVFCHHFIFRPIFLDWGAPQYIRELTFSGDQFTKGKYHTRAVLVRATPEQIWPWLVQMGQDRGGMYSYQALENLIGADIHNVYELRPELQKPRLKGDTIWLANKHRYNGIGHQILAEITPNHSMVMVGGRDYLKINKGESASGSWAFYLYPESQTSTWLIARSSDGNIGFVNRLLRYVSYEVPHFIMERKMLMTIKKLTEEKNTRRQVL